MQKVSTVNRTLPRKQSNLRRHWPLLVFVLPAVIYLFIFHYLPIYGVIIAFEDFKPSLGYLKSPFVGLKHFTRFMGGPKFWELMRNTIYLSLYQLVVTFPMPIILALSVNQLVNRRYQRVVQIVTYAPHFISTVVLVSIMRIMLDPDTGIINAMLGWFNMGPHFFMGKASMFRTTYVLSEVWQNTGWSSIIYFAALSAVDISMHEAAIIDGASKMQRIRYIDFPSILPTIITILILNTGRIMTLSFEKVFAMQNSLNLSVSETIATYVYRIGIKEGQFSYSAAINLFNSVINLALLLGVNGITRKTSDIGIF